MVKLDSMSFHSTNLPNLNIKSRNVFKNLKTLIFYNLEKVLSKEFENLLKLSSSIEKIKISTRQYAKRQMTWFKKDKDVKWFDASKEIDLNLI